MTFHLGVMGDLATLALVSLGATESLVGLHNGLLRAALLLQLPMLVAVAYVPKRSILVYGQLLALVTSAPLLWFGTIAGLPPAVSVAVVLASLALTAAVVEASGSVWFPLLRGYMEPGGIGSFFGTIRSAWHLVLIGFFLGSTFWLREHESGFGLLFAVGWLCGVIRLPLIARLPERDERGRTRTSLGAAAATLLAPGPMRSYLVGISLAGAVRATAVPFTLVMLRREVGFTSAQVVYTTVATYAGGLASLYVWGRVVDRFGAAPVFRATSIGIGLSFLSLLAVSEPGTLTLFGVVLFFFVFASLAAGFGVADTRVLFDLTPPEAPAPTLVLARVVTSAAGSLLPFVAGLTLDLLLDRVGAPLSVYRGLFVAAALLHGLAWIPLRR